MNALPNTMTCFFPHCHTPLIDRYFQENLFKGSFLLFMLSNCLLACLTRQVDTRHTKPHFHIFLMSLCCDAVSNCPFGKRTITLKKRYKPPSQSVSQSAFPSHPAVTLAVWAYRLLHVRGGKSRAWCQTLVILVRMTSIYQIEALDETSYPVSKRHYENHDQNWIGK